jgi:hypothetical protein
MNLTLAIILASVAEFIVGAIWYMPLFGNLWGKIHGFDELSKEEQRQAQKGMAPLLAVQFIGTVITTIVLAKVIEVFPTYNVFEVAALVWVGFFVPTQVSAVIFGGTESKWVLQKSLIMAGGSLACLLVAAAVLQLAL